MLISRRQSHLSPPEPTSLKNRQGQDPTVLSSRTILPKGFHLDVQIESEQIVEAVQIMFELGYFLESITGVDWIKDDQLEVVYDFSRYDFDLCRTVMRTRISRSEPQSADHHSHLHRRQLA